MAATKSASSAYGRKLQAKLDLYFAECDKAGKTPSIAGFTKYAKDSARKGERTAESLSKKIEQYFAECDTQCDIPNEPGLSRFIGVSLGTLRRWHDGEMSVDLQEPVQDAYARMTSVYMQLLLTGNKNMTPFVIFMLKQPRFAGYQDKIESKQDISVNVKMGENVDASDFK